MSIAKKIQELEGLTVHQLRARYAEIFGEATRSANKPWLIKRIGWRIQSRLEGDLSERARQRAAELANDADLRLKPPAPAGDEPQTVTGAVPASDDRLPIVGTTIRRPYKGRTLLVTRLADGFEFEGDHYPSLSAVAKKATGQHLNGFAFFGMTKETAE